MTRTSRCL